MLPTLTPSTPKTEAHREGVSRWHAVLTSRRCPIEHAVWVERTCLRSPAVLPRWHQEDRGRRNEHRGHHDVAGAHEYAGVTAWRSREHFLTVVLPVAIATHPDVLRRRQVSPELLTRYLTVRTGYAHERTGRGCIVRPDSLASVLVCDVRTVQRAQACARELGLEVVIRQGRMLTWAERMRVFNRGSRQRGLSTEVAFTTPDPLRTAVDLATPPKRSKTPRKTGLNTGVPRAASGTKAEATPSPPSNKKRRGDPEARTLALNLPKYVPWVATERPGRLIPALTRFVHCATPWTAQDVALALDDLMQRQGLPAVTPGRIRTRPAVLLAHQLRQLDVDADHPRLLEDPAPCTQDHCDGAGWLHLPRWFQSTGPDGEPTWAQDLFQDDLRPCPTCPPGTRSEGTTWGDDEPEF